MRYRLSLACLLLVAGATLPAAIAFADEPKWTGTYEVVGQNPQGGQYEGVAEIRRKGEAYVMQWRIGQDERYAGTGVATGDSLAVASKQWVIVYERQDDGRLKGVWVQHGQDRVGFEVLTPTGSPI